MNAETRRCVGYGLVLIVCLLFWLHELFPAGSIRTLLENRLSDPTFGRHVAIGRLETRFPFALILEPIDIQLQGKPLLRFDTLTVRLSGIRWNGIRAAVSAKTADGRITGEIGYPVVRDGRWNLHLQFSGIHIDRISDIQQTVGRSMAGEISGNLQPQDRGLVLTLLVKNLKIGLVDPSLGPAQVAFASGEARIEYGADELRLTSAAFQGTQVSGTATGVLQLSETWMDSPIRMEATVRIHPGLLGELHHPGLRALITSRLDREMTVRISGTILQPKWEMNERQ
ncbi:MAG: type II secretion system protein GspN [Thermodesulfobacteriota bacterium]